MPRRLPSLKALRAFEAAARHQSFTRAADELCVTQGAVSHQVKSLELQLGVRLFQRDGHSIALSEAGRSYLNVLRNAFDLIDAGTQQLQRPIKSHVLTVSVSPNFAAKWLVPRLGSFAMAYPEIDVRVSASMEHADLVRDSVDLAVRHGTGSWPGLHITRLCEEELFPVCSPRLVFGKRPLRAPADLARFPLLHLELRDAWEEWLQAANVEGVNLGRGHIFNQASLAIDAAVDGQGIALSRSALSARDLLAGRLVRPFALALPAPFAYYVVCPRALAAHPKIVAFRTWLVREANSDADRLSTLNVGRRNAASWTGSESRAAGN